MTSKAGPSDGGASATSRDYDALPYLSLPISYTQPNALAALAALCGLLAPAPGTARVLELGCASGGNLMPLAARFPGARFVGVDLSARQVSDGNRRIATFGLRNIELICGDIAAVDFAVEGFDYVICHGVFSWVPPEVQDAVLRVASRCLAPNGVAAISYNVLPGWHLREPIRGMLMAHCGSEGSPQARVERARELLKLFETHTGPEPYGALLRDEAKLLALKPGSYILGEFLAAHNAPASFVDFTGRAATHGLDFLCEADLDAGARASVSGEAHKTVAAMAASDRSKAAQYLDFFSGRPFRRSLLVKRSAGGTISQPQAERLAGLHIACKLTPDPARTTSALAAFIDGKGRSITTPVDSVGKTFARLGEAYPATVAVDALAGPDAQGHLVAKVLLQLLQEGRAAISSLPVAVGRAADPRPKAWAFARAEAALGLPMVTSQRHVTVILPKIAAAVISRLDGTNDHAMLEDWLAREIGAGRVPLPDGKEMPTEDMPLAALARQHVAETLRHFEAGAVLVPAA